MHTLLLQPMEVGNYLSGLQNNISLRCEYRRGCYFWPIPATVITDENVTVFKEVLEHNEYMLKRMEDGGCIMYAKKHHPKLQYMSQKEYTNICHVDDMYAFADINMYAEPLALAV